MRGCEGGRFEGIRWAGRAVRVLVAGALLLQTACAGGRAALDRDDLRDPPPARSYFVTLADGTEYTFVSLHVEGDNLLGTARFTEQATVGEGPEARSEVTNRYEEMRIPWGDVRSVEAEGGGRASGGWMFAALSVAVGVGAFLLLSQGSDDRPAGGGVVKK